RLPPLSGSRAGPSLVGQVLRDVLAELGQLAIGVRGARLLHRGGGFLGGGRVVVEHEEHLAEVLGLDGRDEGHAGGGDAEGEERRTFHGDFSWGRGAARGAAAWDEHYGPRPAGDTEWTAAGGRRKRPAGCRKFRLQEGVLDEALGFLLEPGHGQHEEELEEDEDEERRDVHAADGGNRALDGAQERARE